MVQNTNALKEDTNLKSKEFENNTNLNQAQIEALINFLALKVTDIAKIDSEARPEGLVYLVYMVRYDGNCSDEPFVLCLDDDLNVTDITEYPEIDLD